MTNREHVAKILARDVSIKEIHGSIRNNDADSRNEIRTHEALLWLAERIDELEKKRDEFDEDREV